MLDQLPVDLVAMHSSRLPPEGERGRHFHRMPHLLEAEKPGLVHQSHSSPLCLPTFSGVPLSAVNDVHLVCP